METKLNSIGNSAQNELTPEQVALGRIKRVIQQEFDEQTWETTEVVLSTMAAILVEGGAGTGVVLSGPPSSGKTTALEFFEELDDITYRSDDVTPAAFVSADASKSEDQLQENDLLPKLSQKILISRDMSPWFAGDEDNIRKRMSILTHLFDGKGYTRDTGTHGQRGYTGKEYAFNFVGASTPLSPRAWNAMGNVGSRLMFYETRGGEDLDQVLIDVVEGSGYDEKIERVQSVIYPYLRELWKTTGGAGSVHWDQPLDPELSTVLKYLTQLVRYSRATTRGDTPNREGGHRIMATLYNLARGRSVLAGRRHVTTEDMGLCARVALSTIPEKRRPIIRALLDPANSGELLTADIVDICSIKTPTALERMKTVEMLGIGTRTTVDGDDREPALLKLRDEFRWPKELDFPAF